MKRVGAVLGIIVLVSLILYFFKNNESNCLAKTECVQEKIDKHAVRKLQFWKKNLDLPVDQRVVVASDEVLEYLYLDNLRNKILKKPIAAIEESKIRDISSILREMPVSVRNLFEKKLVAIIPVSNLGTSAYSEEIIDDKGNSNYGFIILDVDYLNKTANEWAMWKEQMPFKAGLQYQIKLQIENASNDSIKGALEFILLHELGHIISIGTLLSPSWNTEAKYLSNAKDYPFFAESWSVDQSKNIYWSAFDEVFPQRTNIAFYKEPKIGNSDVLATYSNLLKTNFPTLYSSTLFSEDFADSFATYVHCEILKKPYNLQVLSSNQVVLDVPCCWETARCEKKKDILELILRPFT